MTQQCTRQRQSLSHYNLRRLSDCCRTTATSTAASTENFEERCYRVYLISKHRLDDFKDANKHHGESDASDSGESGQTRSEAKALDRETPWRQTLDLEPADIQLGIYLRAVEKEAASWNDWGSVKALTHAEVQRVNRVIRDKVLRKCVLRTRSCFRDKRKGLGPLAAKWPPGRSGMDCRQPPSCKTIFRTPSASFHSTGRHHCTTWCAPTCTT